MQFARVNQPYPTEFTVAAPSMPKMPRETSLAGYPRLPLTNKRRRKASWGYKRDPVQPILWPPSL
ncbi:predicted protein [Histoplasma mississippiense (nom. inval.)]|uniref:predicted protein n=1 Tax=Ajellomyces capsulatus (strain NAm1 / WU24) TaxID=2059318 RepID=UPI000157C28F|nr:predicted protein [Histoplasma mississippiense (nom. inval.)]EDN07221.1 predicted protein [Histoplasma mississippiense (nom. inval.)]